MIFLINSNYYHLFFIFGVSIVPQDVQIVVKYNFLFFTIFNTLMICYDMNLILQKKKKNRDKKRDKAKEIQASLMVACLKRLLPVGLNLFAGREQELVQHCKDRFLKVYMSTIDAI